MTSQKLRTEGVKNSENVAYLLYGWPLRANEWVTVKKFQSSDDNFDQTN